MYSQYKHTNATTNATIDSWLGKQVKEHHWKLTKSYSLLMVNVTCNVCLLPSHLAEPFFGSTGWGSASKRRLGWKVIKCLYIFYSIWVKFYSEARHGTKYSG